MTRAERAVFIVDDDPGVRDSLKFLVEGEGHTVECFDCAPAFLDRARMPMAGCLVADLRLPGMSGLEMHEKLKAMDVSLPTIMISGHGDVPVAVRALQAGIIDFLEKPFSDRALLDRVAAAVEDDARRREEDRGREALLTRYGKLSPRERQVMTGVVKGRLNKQIAADLGLSHKTIEVHRSHVMDKMRASSLAELVRMAMEIDLDDEQA